MWPFVALPLLMPGAGASTGTWPFDCALSIIMLFAGSIAGLADMLGALLPAAEGSPPTLSLAASTLGDNGAASEVGVAEPAAAAVFGDVVVVGVAVPPAFFLA